MLYEKQENHVEVCRIFSETNKRMNKFKVEDGLRNRHNMGVDCGTINRIMTTFNRA